MKSSRTIFLAVLATVATSFVTFIAPLRAAEPLYKNDFESEEVGKAPKDMLVMAGEFAVKQDKDGKYLELPGEPLDSFGLLFGPSVADDVSACARFFGTKKGRKYPTFGISLNGANGYRLQVSAAKGALEFFKGDESKLSVPYTWTSDTWTMLRITVRKKGAGWVVEGKAWTVGSPEPEKPTITLDETTAPAKARAGLWGSPYSGTPIKFDDLLIEPANELRLILSTPTRHNSTMRLLVPILALSVALPLHADDWPQYRGLTGDGKSSEKIVMPAGNSTPRQLWKAPSEGGFSSFAVAGGRAFTLSLKDAEGAKQESVVAYDAKTGKELWSQPLNFAKYDGGGDSGAPDNKGGDGPRSTPTTNGKWVYVMSSQLVLRTFDAASGKPLWSHDLIKEFAGRNIQWENAASPLGEGNNIYVGGGGPGQSLIAFNATNGAVVWKAFDEKITHATPVAATILGQRQIIFFLQSGLLAVEPNTGKELWRYTFDYKTSTAASPVVDGDIVYCSAGYGVGAGAVHITKDASGFKATEIYRFRGNKPLANHWSTPIAKDGYLYGMFQFKEYANGPVKCVDIKTGDVKWEQPGFGPGQVILVGDRVLALSDNGDLVTFEASPKGYKELSRAKVLDGKCWTTPIVANGMIFARSTKEAVCLDVSGH